VFPEDRRALGNQAAQRQLEHQVRHQRRGSVVDARRESGQVLAQEEALQRGADHR
jgi:hypothetical protein